MIRKLIAGLLAALFVVACSAPQKTVDRNRIDQNKQKASSRLNQETAGE